MVSNPYLEESKQYTIQSALIEQVMDDDGMFHVHETIDYEMTGNFRGLYRNLPTGRYVEISNIEIWTEGREAKHEEKPNILNFWIKTVIPSKPGYGLYHTISVIS